MYKLRVTLLKERKAEVAEYSGHLSRAYRIPTFRDLFCVRLLLAFIPYTKSQHMYSGLLVERVQYFYGMQSPKDCIEFCDKKKIRDLQTRSAICLGKPMINPASTYTVRWLTKLF
jgi:hypothetical protein